MAQAGRDGRWESVLVVDPSPVVRELVTLHLRVRGHPVEAVASLDEARSVLERRPPAYLVLAAENGGMALLREVARMPDPRPHVVVTSRRHSLDEETQASLEGAIGYLAKPLRLSELDRALGCWPLVFDASSAPRATRGHLARALFCDPKVDAAMVECDVHDLSRSGAFLLSGVPLAPGSPLRLVLGVSGTWHALEARVVRVQDPSWDHPAGVGIEFIDLPGSAQRAIDRFVGTVRRGTA